MTTAKPRRPRKAEMTVNPDWVGLRLCGCDQDNAVGCLRTYLTGPCDCTLCHEPKPPVASVLLGERNDEPGNGVE